MGVEEKHIPGPNTVGVARALSSVRTWPLGVEKFTVPI